MLTERVLHESRCLHEAYEALHSGVPLISVSLSNRGYDFAKAKEHLQQLAKLARCLVVNRTERAVALAAAAGQVSQVSRGQ